MIRIFSQYVSVKSLLLMLLEGILIALSLVCGVKVRFLNEPDEFEYYTAMPDFAIQVAVVVVVLQVCFYYNDLYRLAAVGRRGEQVARVGASLGAACLLLGLIYFLFPWLLIGRGVFVITVAFVGGFVMLTRIALDTAWRATTNPNHVLIVGTGPWAQTVARELGQRDDLNVRFVGFVSPRAEDATPGSTLFGMPVLGPAADLEALAQAHRVSRIIVALEDNRAALPIRALVKLRVSGVEVEDTPTALAGLTGRVWLETARPSWFVFSGGFSRSKLTLMLKRMFDLAFGLTGFLVTLPLMLVVALAVKLSSRGPAMYRQVRVGLRGERFEVMKFRSMIDDAESDNGAQWAQVDDPRITTLGRFLRRYRLDELPQFLNVVRGHMSFVGPRPERPVFVEQLKEQIYYDERHSVRPGLTGWAQVQHPYCETPEDHLRKLEYDLFYVKNLSILFDCAIVFQTVRIVLFGRGGR